MPDIRFLGEVQGRYGQPKPSTSTRLIFYQNLLPVLLLLSILSILLVKPVLLILSVLLILPVLQTGPIRTNRSTHTNGAFHLLPTTHSNCSIRTTGRGYRLALSVLIVLLILTVLFIFCPPQQVTINISDGI